jgi:signal transduction histidine kinase
MSAPGGPPRFPRERFSREQWEATRRWHHDRKWETWGGRPPGYRMPARARLWIPVVVSLVIQVTGALWTIRLHDGPAWQVAATLVLAVVGPASLLLARKLPGPVVAFTAAAATVDILIVDPLSGPPYIALAFAIGGAIVRGARIWAWVSIGVGWIVTLVLAGVMGLALHPGRIASTTLGILIVLGLGEAVRTRREHYEEYRRQYAQRKVSEVQAERVRIARELHDVLAHSLSQINVQAGVGLHLADQQPAKAREALASIKETSKTALDEVRSVLGVLRDESRDPEAPLVPEPDLSRLPTLIAGVAAQGLDVTSSIDPADPALSAAPKPVQLAIYRIVQESLTNVLRHSGATRASVDVGIDDGDGGAHYVITVDDNGSGFAATEPGRGLTGIRERAELLGGTLETGRSPSGGAEVVVRIPVREGSA